MNWFGFGSFLEPEPLILLNSVFLPSAFTPDLNNTYTVYIDFRTENRSTRTVIDYREEGGMNEQSKQAGSHHPPVLILISS